MESKYKALNQQRLNERKIRAEKEKIIKAEQVLKLEPNDTLFKIQKEQAKNNIKILQAEQRKLENEVLKNEQGEVIKDEQGNPIKKYDNLQRSYSREALNQKVDFNGGKTKIEVKFTNADNDKLIGRKRIGLSKKPFDYIMKRSQAMLTKKKDDVRMTIEAKSDPRLYYENCLVRKYYHEQLSKISGFVSKGKTIEEQALIAFNARNDIRLDVRSKIVDLKALSLLPESKSFEKLITSKMQRKGTTREEVLKDIKRYYKNKLYF